MRNRIMTVKLHDGERLDDLILAGMKVIQRPDQFCFSLDTILLAHFGDVPRGPVLDLGTGTAAIPLILAARGVKKITALELNPVMADIAARNVELNGKDAVINVENSDYRQLATKYSAGYLRPFMSIPLIVSSFEARQARGKGFAVLVMKKRLPLMMSSVQLRTLLSFTAAFAWFTLVND